MTPEQLLGIVPSMGSTTIMYCEVCREEVEVIVSDSEILDGVTSDDDTHVREGHELSVYAWDEE